jgi:hypothetical protein
MLDQFRQHTDTRRGVPSNITNSQAQELPF